MALMGDTADLAYLQQAKQKNSSLTFWQLDLSTSNRDPSWVLDIAYASQSKATDYEGRLP